MECCSFEISPIVLLSFAAIASVWYFQVRFYEPTHQDWHSDKMFVFDELLLSVGIKQKCLVI